MTRRSKDSRHLSAREFLAVANSPLLDCESADDFDSMRRAIESNINPHRFIEELYASDVVAIEWELLRLRRCKKEMINQKYSEWLLYVISRRYTLDEDDQKRVSNIASEWRKDERTRKKLFDLMDEYEISPIEVETLVIQNTRELNEALDNEIIRLEMRRDKALKSLATYRYSFGATVNSAADLAIEAENSNVPRLCDKTAKKSAA